MRMSMKENNPSPKSIMGDSSSKIWICVGQGVSFVIWITILVFIVFFLQGLSRIVEGKHDSSGEDADDEDGTVKGKQSYSPFKLYISCQVSLI